MTAVVAILYALFAACALVAATPGLPWRWSLAAFLMIVHLGLPGAGGEGGDPVIDNALKAILLPALLLLRTRFEALRPFIRRPFFLVWLTFLAYAGLAVLWSPFATDGLKTLAYLFGYTATGLILHFSLRRRPADAVAAFHHAAWFGLAVAVVQTYVLGGRYAGADPDRFSSFVAPQSFGIFLALAFGILLVFRTDPVAKPRFYDLLLILILPAVVLNGSRLAFLIILGTALWSLAVWLAKNSTLQRLLVTGSTVGLVTVLLLGTLFLAPPTWWFSLKRPNDLPRAAAPLGVLFGSYGLEDIGTLRFRLEMYDAIIDFSESRRPSARWFGSGTGSVGEVVATGYYPYRGMDYVTVDPNRVAHNELLRVYYDLGVFGLALLVVVIAGLGGATLRVVWLHRTIQSLLLLGLMGVVFVVLVSQNLFAASVHPSGTAVSLIVAAVLWRGSEGFSSRKTTAN